MPSDAQESRAAIPSIDNLLKDPVLDALQAACGRPLVLETLREVVAETRERMPARRVPPAEELCARIAAETRSRVERSLEGSLKPVFNLTGTVLHTNLGRAALPIEAIAAMSDVASGSSNLEFSLKSGRRGDRDSHLEEWLTRLTGCEAATVVNNNAAAVLLVLNTLALRKEVPVSRGELIEIGGSFRMPNIMARAGCKLVEVGTTNRTHPGDYTDAITARTALFMRVHTSNYVVEGFTAEVNDAALAKLAHDHGLAMVNDLGSGSLIDLRPFGLPHEPTVREALAEGADIVTFSGDKLLGGPQCGIIVGRADLIDKIKRNPLKRALRVDKMTIAALDAVLRLYANPETLSKRLPALRQLSRDVADITAQAERLMPELKKCVPSPFDVQPLTCTSQIGSGALPVDALPSAGLRLGLPAQSKSAGSALGRLAGAFRALPKPVIGRVHNQALEFDFRCLEDEQAFVDQLTKL